jgi:hypothetical protein
VSGDGADQLRVCGALEARSYNSLMAQHFIFFVSVAITCAAVLMYNLNGGLALVIVSVLHITGMFFFELLCDQ